MVDCVKDEDEFPDPMDAEKCRDCHDFEETQRELETDWANEGYVSD